MRLAVGSGGGILNTGAVTMNNGSTVARNTAGDAQTGTSGQGGGIYSGGMVTMNNGSDPPGGRD